MLENTNLSKEVIISHIILIYYITNLLKHLDLTFFLLTGYMEWNIKNI